MSLHVGYAPVFQNPGNALSDAEVYQEELRLAELAEPLGFDSVWSIEHHFTDYTMCPDAVQFLSYIAGKNQAYEVGHDGHRPAVARSGPGCRTNIAARPSVGRPDDLGLWPGLGPG